MSAINLHFSGDTVDAVKAQILGFATLAGAAALSSFSTEDLVHELRDRMAKNSIVVKIVPFAEENSSGAEQSTAGATTRKPRTPKADKAAAVPEANPAQVDPPKADPVQAIADAAGAATQDSGAKADEPKTIEDVKTSLNAFAALLGQMPARKIMEEVGGSPALKDIPAEKYGELVRKLDEKRAEAAATKQAA